MSTIWGRTVEILLEAVILFREMAPYILLGALLAGILHAFLRKDWIARHTGKGWKAVWLSSLFGVPLPLCSCGVVPAARFMKKSGSSPAAVISFLISTPQTGIDSLMATGGILGPFMAVFRAIAAFLSGVAGGTLSFFMGGRKGDQPAEDYKTANSGKVTIRERIPGVFRYAFGETMEDLAIPLPVGLLVAAALGVLMPADFFAGSPFSKGLPGMLLTGLMGIPLYVCSTSSIPVALVLMAKGFSPGAAFVFLMTGPATNAASLAIFLKTIGKKQTLIYLVSIFATAIAGGLVLDLIIPFVPEGWITITGGIQDTESLGKTIFETVMAVSLSLMLLWQFYLKLKGRLAPKPQTCSCHTSPETSE